MRKKIGEKLTFDCDFGGTLEAIDDHIAAIAAQLPGGRQCAVQDKHARLALHTAGDAQRVERVRAGGMRAGIAAAKLGHIPERWMIVAVRAERKRATLDARRERQQAEIIQRTLELPIHLHIAIGQRIVLVAVRAVQPSRLRLKETAIHRDD